MSRCKDRQAVLSTAAAAQAVQLQGVASGGQREAVSLLREWRRDRRENGRDFRGAGDEHAGGSDLHRNAGDSGWRDLFAGAEYIILCEVTPLERTPKGH